MGKVRIIGGRARGRTLSVPNGPVRPTTDRVREALFNVLAHRFAQACADARVLDLFAGAGTLGLEAASRGAKRVRLIEGDAGVFATLRKNAGLFDGDVRAVHRRVDAFLTGPAAPCDLIFMDPPYAADLVQPTLAHLVSGSWLAPQGLICVEHARDQTIADPPQLETAFTRGYGASAVTILHAAE